MPKWAAIICVVLGVAAVIAAGVASYTMSPGKRCVSRFESAYGMDEATARHHCPYSTY